MNYIYRILMFSCEGLSGMSAGGIGWTRVMQGQETREDEHIKPQMNKNAIYDDFGNC